MLFSPTSGYICTRLIKYSTSPLLPMGPAVLREEGLYDSDRDRPRVAWKQWWWGGVWATLSLRLLFIQIPSSASERATAGEKSPEPPPWAPGKAQMSPAPVPLVLGRRDAVPAPPTPCLAIAPSPGHPPGPPRHAEKSALPQLWLFSVPGPPPWMPPKC